MDLTFARHCAIGSAGEYKGFVEMGVLCQSLENPAIRSFYHVPPTLSGVVINEVHPTSDLASVLQKGDVILEVDGKAVANDGTIAFRNLERVLMSHALSRYVGKNKKSKNKKKKNNKERRQERKKNGRKRIVKNRDVASDIATVVRGFPWSRENKREMRKC